MAACSGGALHSPGIFGLWFLRRADGAKKVLHGRGEAVAEKSEALVAAIIDPVELDDAALAFERQMPVPGTVGAQEGDERALGRGHFDGYIVDVVTRAKKPKAAAGIVPRGIQVEQDGDNFTGGVIVNLAVVRAASAADGDGGRAVGEVHFKFFLERFAKFLGLKRVNHGLEARTEFNGIEREAARLRDAGIIGIDAAERFGFYKIAKDKMLVGYALKRCGAESFEIEDAVGHGLYCQPYLSPQQVSSAGQFLRLEELSASTSQMP
jgi:hypothetical protein